MGLRKVFVFLLLLLPTVCWGYALHIGNASIPAHTEKYTTPSFNIMTDTGDIYHIPMTPQNIYGTLHVLSNDIVYSACVGEKTRVGKYWFIGNCLVDADDDVYLESGSNHPYIDSNVIPDENTKMFIDVQDLYGQAIFNYMGVRNPNFSILSSSISNKFVAFLPGQTISSLPWDNLRHTFELSQQDGYIVDNQYVYSVDSFVLNTGSTIFVFGDHVATARARVYKAKIWKSNRLLRHLIPVQSGMQIGNYTVPSNGMWDVVEQKFYGNVGAGNFIYGIDE